MALKQSIDHARPDNFAAVLDDLKAGKIDVATARARIAGRI